MKKTLILALIFISIGTVSYAQVPLKRDSLRQTTTVMGATPTKKDMIVISQAEMPVALKSTLEAIEYQGWEKGTVYRTKLNDMFMVEIRRGNTMKSYHFDVNGKPLDP
ncbi:MAG: hypothetical protein ABIS36_20765 [Chryseolinea sp.]